MQQSGGAEDAQVHVACACACACADSDEGAAKLGWRGAAHLSPWMRADSNSCLDILPSRLRSKRAWSRQMWGNALEHEGPQRLATLIGPAHAWASRPERAAPASGTETIAPVRWALFSLGVCDNDEQVRALEAAQLDDRARERRHRPRNPPMSKMSSPAGFQEAAPGARSYIWLTQASASLGQSAARAALMPAGHRYRPCFRHSASLQQETEGADAVAEVKGAGHGRFWRGGPCELPKRLAGAFDGVVQLLDGANVLRVMIGQREP